jgi:hypothetical protein
MKTMKRRISITLMTLSLIIGLVIWSQVGRRVEATEAGRPGASPGLPALCGKAAVDHLKQQGLYDSLQAAMTSAQSQVNPLSAHSAQGGRQVKMGAASRLVDDAAAAWPMTLHPTLTQQAKLTASDAAAVDLFGNSVAISVRTIVVGSQRDDDAGADSGSAYVFVRSGTNWSQQAKLTASDAAAGDEFGVSVAISGETIVVGAPSDSDAGPFSGSAYVFVRNGMSWSQQAKLTASDAAAGDEFGISVTISGRTVVVGSRSDDDAGFNSGSAYVFVRGGVSWRQQAKLVASDAAAVDRFGTSVAISGRTVVIGSPEDDDTAGINQGSVYVFVWSGTSWNQQAKLMASDAAAVDRFGTSVAISGETVAVGAPLDDDACRPANPLCESGSAYIFRPRRHSDDD